MARTTSLIVTVIGCFAVAVWAARDGKPDTQKVFFKGNLHTHSLWSDGDDFPEMIADWYKSHDYDFLALTEHNVMATGEKWVDAATNKTREEAVTKCTKRFGADWLEKRTVKDRPQVRLKTLAQVREKLDTPGKFLLVAGEEITHKFGRLPVHMNAINLGSTIKPADGGSVAETITVNARQVAEQKIKSGREIITFLNHPNFGWGVNSDDMTTAEELKFFEVYNGHPGTNQNGDKDRPGCERLWDLVVTRRMKANRRAPLLGLATDDAHNYHVNSIKSPTPGRGWVMVRATSLEPEALMQAMASGDFYASTGVTLENLNYAKKVLGLRIKAEPEVTYTTTFHATLKDAGPDGIGLVVSTVTGSDVAYEFKGNELYVRAKVTSTKKHPNPSFADEVECAWTQPMKP